MNRPPEWPSPVEEKQIAEMIETNIDFATEQKHIHEVVADDVDSEDI